MGCLLRDRDAPDRRGTGVSRGVAMSKNALLEQWEEAARKVGWTFNTAKMQWEFWRDGELLATATARYLKAKSESEEKDRSLKP